MKRTYFALSLVGLAFTFSACGDGGGGKKSDKEAIRLYSQTCQNNCRAQNECGIQEDVAGCVANCKDEAQSWNDMIKLIGSIPGYRGCSGALVEAFTCLASIELICTAENELEYSEMSDRCETLEDRMDVACGG